MSKTLITKDQLIARNGGWTTYINDAGTKVKARNSAVEVVDEGESARAPKPKAAKAPKAEPRITRAGRVSEACEDLDADEDEDEEADGKRRIGNTRHDCSHYEKTQSANGNKTLDSGDGLAVELRGMALADLYARAAKELDETEKSLRQRYAALNPGMQRMNLGNRMRANLRKLAKLEASR